MRSHADHAQEAALDSVVPGAGLVAKIIGMAADLGTGAGVLHGAVKKPSQKKEVGARAEEEETDPDFP